jgi:hypothetical protein
MLLLAIRCVAWLAPLLFVVSTTAPLIGQRLPPPQLEIEEIGFAACTLPCWAGITPGLTPFAEASELMAEHLPAFSIPSFLTTSTLSFQTITSEPNIAGALYYDSTRVSEVHLEVALPIGYLLDRLGTPDCVWVSQGNLQAVMAVYWEGEELSTGAYLIFDGRMAWKLEMPTRYLQMSTTLTCNSPEIVPWMGFAPAWRYDEAASRTVVP